MTGEIIGGTGTALINILFLAILFVVAIAIARLRSLFAIVMLSGVNAINCFFAARKLNSWAL